MSVSIDVSEQQLKKARERLKKFPERISDAIEYAANDAIKEACVEATKRIQGQYVVRNKKVISQAVKVTKKATKRSLVAAFEAKGSPIPLGAFLTNPNRAPKRKPKNHLFAQVKIDGGGTIKGAFITTVETGHIGVKHADVFIRVKGNSSLPIRKLYGPSVPQMLGNQEISMFIEKKARTIFEQCFENELNYMGDD